MKHHNTRQLNDLLDIEPISITKCGLRSQRWNRFSNAEQGTASRRCGSHQS